MPDAFGDSSEDEFPEVDVVVRQYRHKMEGRQEKGDFSDEEVGSPDENKSKSQKRHGAKNAPAVKATPLRRRKLGQTQIVDKSLLKPWDDTAAGVKKIREPNLKGPRARIQIKEERIQPDYSEDVPDPQPARAPQRSSRTIPSRTDSKLISEKVERFQKGGNEKNQNVKAKSISKASTKNSTPSAESSEESDMFEGKQESSEEDVSEFVSESDSESDSWNSDSGHSKTPPTRRSRSPTVQWAKPQATLFKDPDKKAAPSKQPQATITQPTDRLPKQRGTLKTLKASQPGNLEDAFRKLQIFNEDSELDEPSVKKGKNPTVEPTTPRKTLKTIPASPLKTPKIPMSPWKPEHKEFWDSEEHFGWIDKHSPEKKLESPQKTKTKATAQELKMEAKRKYGVSPEKKDARKAFDATKENLARDFLQELDDRITDGKLSQLTKDTGGLRITWSKALLTTAGRAYWKCRTESVVVGYDDEGRPMRRETRQHTGSIELATRVLGNESDLLNTVAHEFCHLAVFMLHGKPKMTHGTEFKAFGTRCGCAFGDRGIEVTTRHNYEIDFKYIWECSSCKGQVKRHGRSVDVRRQRCGKCRGELVQVKPTPRGKNADGGDGTASPKKKPSLWDEFRSREMKALSQTHPGMLLKDKMAIVSARWAEARQQQNQEKELKEEKREKTIQELQTAVDILTIDDEGEGEAADDQVNSA